MNQNDTPVIVCAADDRYAMPLAVMLRSMVQHLWRYPAVQVWVLDGGVSWRNKRRMAHSLPVGKVELHWVRPSHRQLRGAPVDGHVSICTYYRLIIAEMLPLSISKVIYLDVDALVMGDIGELWDVELNKNVVSAVPQVGMTVSDPYGLAMYEELGLPPDAPYFNAGVLLLDLARWRKMDLGRQALQFVAKYSGKLHFWDQAVLNGILAGAWGALDLKWNVCVGHLWQGNVAELVEQPGTVSVMHFASSIKPWGYCVQHPARELFFQWMDQTAWAGWRPVRPWVDMKNVRRNLGDRHWYGKCIRTTPGVGYLWGRMMRWVKG
jgi:lipopolysaccharide biosynthesis glycosyltransferase